MKFMFVNILYTQYYYYYYGQDVCRIMCFCVSLSFILMMSKMVQMQMDIVFTLSHTQLTSTRSVRLKVHPPNHSIFTNIKRKCGVIGINGMAHMLSKND